MKTDLLQLLARVGFAVLIAELVLILLSWILSATGLEGVRSLLSSEGVRWFFGGFSRMVASPVLVWLLLLLSALGAFQKSGLSSLFALRFGQYSYRDRVALRLAVVLLVCYLAVVSLLAFTPHAILLSSTGLLFPSAFSRSLVPVVAFGIVLVSVSFGVASGRIRSLADTLSALSFGIQKGAALLVLYVFFIQFYGSLCFVFA